MSEALPHLIEKSIEIAWDYLERTGEIADADEASRFLLRRRKRTRRKTRTPATRNRRA
jgi:hypothetical protein